MLALVNSGRRGDGGSEPVRGVLLGCFLTAGRDVWPPFSAGEPVGVREPLVWGTQGGLTDVLAQRNLKKSVVIN